MATRRDRLASSSLAIIAIAIFAIGNRLLFTAASRALLLAIGGWERLAFGGDAGQHDPQLLRHLFGPDRRPHSRILVHGTTIHGIQNLGSPERERMATSYYAPPSGVGLAMAAAPALFGDRPASTIVGLGAGTLACYARPGQSWTFYEIDPAVVAHRPRPRPLHLPRPLPARREDRDRRRAPAARARAAGDRRRPGRRRLLVRRGADASAHARGVCRLPAACSATAACCSSTSPTAISI